jgi:Uncharacterized conserved protein
MPTLVDTIKASVKEAMRAKDKQRLGTLRLIQAEFKRIEVDERIDIDDARAIAIMDKNAETTSRFCRAVPKCRTR